MSFTTGPAQSLPGPVNRPSDQPLGPNFLDNVPVDRNLGRGTLEGAQEWFHDVAVRCGVVSCSEVAAQGGGEASEDFRVRLHGIESVEIEPLHGEAGNEAGRLGVGQHALHLLLQNARGPQLLLRGQVEKLIIRNAAPNKEGEA